METLYHYCPTLAFHGIITTKAIRLSALAQSNDSLEGRLVERAIVRLATRDGRPRNEIEWFKFLVGQIYEKMDGLAFCLSESGDLLSQWRGYANDANGLSIGFSVDYFKWLEARARGSSAPRLELTKAAYQESEHDTAIEAVYAKIKSQVDSGALQVPPSAFLSDERVPEQSSADVKMAVRAMIDIYDQLLPLETSLYKLKSSAFSEEREWRMLSHISRGSDPAIMWFPKPDLLVPFKEAPLSPGPLRPIVEVILGPKNRTPNKVVEHFLEKNGFQDVQLRRSNASYQ